MKHRCFALTLAASSLLSLPTLAEPYCDALTSKETLPKKYATRGPFYSDRESGWIVGQDQLKADFEVTEEVKLLWREIASEFSSYGSDLVVLSAPPRPLFIPTDVLDHMGLDGKAIQQTIRISFSSYIAQLNNVGLTAPDLSKLAGQQDGETFYFQRDTHWTPIGAATAAAHLGTMLTPETHRILSEVLFNQSYDEPGSLSAVVERTCGSRPLAETVLAASFAKKGDATALLMDAVTETKIALIGTSFSDRHKRDSYQVAGALAHVLNADVENFAMTGGGVSASMLAFIESGALRDNQYKTVIWETPYTAPLTRVDDLRLVLGALQALKSTETGEVGTIDASDDWSNLKQSFDALEHKALSVQIPGVTEGKLVLELIDAEGTKQRVKLTKSNRVPSELRSDTWIFALAGIKNPNVKRVKLRLVGEDTRHKARLTLLR